MDSVLDWVDAQKDEVDGSLPGFPMLDGISAEPKQISRRLWALLGPLIAGDSSMHNRFSNCPHHNGFKAWRRVAEPINDDKVLILKEHLPAVTIPSPAKCIEDLTTALDAWDTSLGLFTTAGGKFHRRSRGG